MSDSMSQPPSTEAGLFGVELDRERDKIVIIGAPFEATASYGGGTSQTPEAIIAASHQLDFFDLGLKAEFGDQVGMLPFNKEWREWNALAKAMVDETRREGTAPEKREVLVEKVNAISEKLNAAVEREARNLLDQGKIVGVLGGDHSTPLGAMKACHSHWPDMGVLHIDAHHDLRCAYEGFTWSHASIMYNLLHEIGPMPLVSVGIRDFCKEEHQMAAELEHVFTWYDAHLKAALFKGETWRACCERIIADLPKNVYVSFDIDGLDPSLCPNTGTPVPGGLDFQQACYLLELVRESGRNIIGFDLCEVAPDSENPENEWDLNVGARILHKLCVVAGGYPNK